MENYWEETAGGRGDCSSLTGFLPRAARWSADGAAGGGPQAETKEGQTDSTGALLEPGHAEMSTKSKSRVLVVNRLAGAWLEFGQGDRLPQNLSEM